MIICGNNNIQDIKLYQGDSLDIDFTVMNGDTVQQLLLYKVRFVVFDTSIVKTSTVSTEIDIYDPVNGKCKVHILPADTASLDTGNNYTYDAEIYNEIAGTVYTFAQGSFIIG